jgi:Family of unknown function (DUF5906)
MAHKQLIVCEEVKGNGTIRQDSEAIKDWITGKTALVNEKYEKARPIRNVANFLFLSNDRQPLFVTKLDRRMVIIEVPNKCGDEHGIALNAWSKNGGVSFVRYFFEHDVDFAGFSPTADARPSPAKTAVISAGRSAIEQWAQETMEDDERPAFITNRELYQSAVNELHIGDGKHTQLSNALEGAGAFRVRPRFRIDPKLRDIKDPIWQLRGERKELSDDELRAALEGERERRLQFSGKQSVEESFENALRKQELDAAVEKMREAERERNYYKDLCLKQQEKDKDKVFRERMKEVGKEIRRKAKLGVKEAAAQDNGDSPVGK